MSDDTRPMSGAPTLLAGRYRLQGSIGQGGMADVQRAYDEQLDREVAVKLLHARYADDPNFLLRFRREAQAAASLNHPNIVSVYDAGDADGRPFIVMELVRGRSLRQLTRTERITAERATEIVGDAALGLNYAHEHGLIHRDIKPGNILISQDGEVKVTDFGIARAVNAETITETAAVFGTAAYVSPEQAQGEPVDRRTDVYSLGCVLYELLAGRQPFHADSPVALAYQHVSATPPPPSQLSDESSPELDAITAKAMAKDPADRYQTAREFNADLERARAGVPVVAPLAGAWAATQAADRWNEQTVASTPAGATETYPADEDAYARYDEEPRSRTGLILGLLLLLVALAAAGWWLFTTLTADQIDTSQVPDVVGMQEAAAIEALEAQGFTDITTEEVQQSGAGENEVVDQAPQPSDEAIPVDTQILLTVNTGPPSVEVPDVSGQTEQEASQQLRQANLRVGQVRRRVNENVPEGLVIRSQPPAGDEVPENTEVVLIISRGSGRATVPDVVGQPEDTAIQRLAEACDPQPCFEAVTTQQFNDDVGEGRVFQQVPSAGEELQQGQQVTLFISRGAEPPPEPATTAVPNVVGENLNDATDALQEANLAIGTVTQEPSGDVDAGSVIATDPQAGEEVEERTRVDLVISTGPEPTEGPDTTNSDPGNGGDGSGNG